MDALQPIVTSSGLVGVRYLEPSDGELLVDLAARLSPESRYHRFHVPMEFVDPLQLRERLQPYLDVDRKNHVALVAWVNEDERERAIGVARFKRQPGSIEAEVAVVVRDDWQGQGVASSLLQQLIAIARGLGIERMAGFVQSSNRAALALVASLGIRTEHHLEHGEDYLVLYLA